jgi:hypothetical protein
MKVLVFHGEIDLVFCTGWHGFWMLGTHPIARDHGLHENIGPTLLPLTFWDISYQVEELGCHHQTSQS